MLVVDTMREAGGCMAEGDIMFKKVEAFSIVG
jgi:hypothetical protein